MSSQGRKGRKNPRVADGAAEDPERLLIAAELAETPRSAAQLADVTGLSLARIRRRLRQLKEEGLIESVKKETKRGTIEHFHFLVGALMRDEGEISELSFEERRRLYGQLLKVILTEATRALVTHPQKRSLERLDGALVRTPIFTDEAGWKELAKLHRDFFERVLEARGRIAKRLEETGEEGFKASSVVMLFESETTS